MADSKKESPKDNKPQTKPPKDNKSEKEATKDSELQTEPGKDNKLDKTASEPSQSVRSSKSHHRIAVETRTLRLVYGSGVNALHVLQGIDLTVPEGAIYGLLGPSGCGKTTLLRCILGRLKPRVGRIQVFGALPNTPESDVPGTGVGYMPQDIALYPEITIGETLTYFGKLYLLTNRTLKERMASLLAFLDLPGKNRLVQHLSGGQQRRVSLAVALIHKPPLLILDEPTVGVDPLLRESIWEHLVTLTSSEGMTVIITTHYVEEARKANVVGFMRAGRLLAEAPPDKLMKLCGSNSLEDVFLKLCKKDIRRRSVGMIRAEKEVYRDDIGEHDETKRFMPPVDDIPDEFAPGEASTSQRWKERSISIWSLHFHPPSLIAGFGKTMAIFNKNIIRLRRNLPLLLFQFIIPTIQVILFCTCIGRDPFALPVAVYNGEKPNPAFNYQSFGEMFLEHLSRDKTVKQIRFDNLEDALESVRNGETWAALVVPENFSLSIYDRVVQGLSASNETIEGSIMDVYPDTTNQQVGFALQKALLNAMQEFIDDTLRQGQVNPRLADKVVRIRDPIYGTMQASFTEFMAPGIILAGLYIMAVGLTAMTFVVEKKEGLLDRGWVAGATAFQVMASHVMTQFLVIVVQSALILIFTFLVFQIPCRGSMAWIVLLTLLQGFCGMAFGLVISACCNEENTALMLALGSFYPNLLMSGIVWPVQGMPTYVRYLSYCLPQTLACEAMRCILFRGWGMTYYQVWIGFVVSFSWFIGFLLTAWLIVRTHK